MALVDSIAFFQDQIETFQALKLGSLKLEQKVVNRKYARKSINHACEAHIEKPVIGDHCEALLGKPHDAKR